MGGLALIWASLGFFSAINSAVNSAWRVERQRSYLKHKLVAFLMLAAACGLLALTLVVFSASQVVGASWFATVVGALPVADGAAELRRELGGDLRADPGGRAGVLLRAQREGALPRRVGRRRADGTAVAVGLCRLLVVRARHVALQRARVDWRRRGLPALGVRLGGDPACTASSSPPPTAASAVAAPTRLLRRRR